MKYNALWIVPILIIILMLTHCTILGEDSQVLINDKELLDNDTAFVKCSIAPWYDGKDKAVVFTWDDTHVGSGKVADVFDSYDLKTTFFLNTAALDNVKFRLRYPFIKSMYQDIENHGHEIGTHTHNNVNLLMIPTNQIELELLESAEAIKRHFGFRPSTMSHPTSHYNEYVDSLTSLHYLDSRYSIAKDKDSTIRFMQVRKAYDFKTYKRDLDAFIVSDASRYVYGGHQLDENGYEPMSSGTLDSLLLYLSTTHKESCWVTTFENMTLYEILRDSLQIESKPGCVIVRTENISPLLEKYTHADAIITFCFEGILLDFYSESLSSVRYKNGNSYVSINLRDTDRFYYSTQSIFMSLPVMRNE